MTIAAQSLETIQIAGGELYRTAVHVGPHQVVVFHKVHPILQPRFASRQQWDAFLDGSHGAPVLEVKDSNWRWSQADPTSFNCHSLSIGSHVGLGPEDWLEGSAGEYTLNRNPARILLDSFFDCVLQWDGDEPLDERRLEDLHTITLEHDVTGDIIHSGTIRWLEGTPMVVSKLGEHPIVISKLQVLLNEYAGQFTHVRTYCLRDA